MTAGSPGVARGIRADAGAADPASLRADRRRPQDTGDQRNQVYVTHFTAAPSYGAVSHGRNTADQSW